MKKCPFCAEQIQDEAIKCRFCNEFLDGSTVVRKSNDGMKWYYATNFIIIALLCAGPLALPLVWLHPKYKIATKLVVTVLIVTITVGCMIYIQRLYQQMMDMFLH